MFIDITNIHIMIEQIIDILHDTALSHVAVKTFRYQKKQYDNAQNGHATYQVYVESNPLFQKLVSRQGIFTCTLNFTVLSQPTADKGVLSIQDEALTIASEIIHYITLNYENIDLYDYSFLLLDEYSTDKSAGCRCTLEVIVPDAVNLCTFIDNFIPINEDDATEVTDNEEVEFQMQTLNLNPRRL